MVSGPIIDQSSKNRPSFVFEIGSEELPATDVNSALTQLRELAPKMLKTPDWSTTRSSFLPHRDDRASSCAISRRSRRRSISMVRGPALKAAFDKDGKPTKAAEGFARGQGVAVEDLLKVEEKGNQYVYAKKHDAGKPAG